MRKLTLSFYSSHCLHQCKIIVQYFFFCRLKSWWSTAPKLFALFFYCPMKIIFLFNNWWGSGDSSVGDTCFLVLSVPVNGLVAQATKFTRTPSPCHLGSCCGKRSMTARLYFVVTGNKQQGTISLGQGQSLWTRGHKFTVLHSLSALTNTVGTLTGTLHG